MRILLTALLALAACDTTSETEISNKGTACVVDDTITIDFETCLSSSCDTLTEASCSAELDGDVLVVVSSAVVVSQGNECTADCGIATVDCALPEGADAATTIRYAGEDVDIDATCPTL